LNIRAIAASSLKDPEVAEMMVGAACGPGLAPPRAASGGRPVAFRTPGRLQQGIVQRRDDRSCRRARRLWLAGFSVGTLAGLRVLTAGRTVLVSLAVFAMRILYSLNFYTVKILLDDGWDAL
jgi:hypothetical protein